MQSDDNSFIEIASSEKVDDATIWTLILSSASIPHTVKTTNQQVTLLVPEKMQLRAEYELSCYYQENKNWPPVPPEQDRFTPTFLPFSLLVVGILAIFFQITGPWSSQTTWFVAGAGDATKILTQMEWYRLVTALTLHADLVHLTGNCVIGGAMLHFLCKSTGNGVCLFLSLIAAIMGNLVNVLMHGSNHLFVGFSTLVFAVIGIQSSLQFSLRRHQAISYLRLSVPFMAGFGLLAVFGASGERTDLGAHLFGLLCGIVVGLVSTPWIMQHREKSYLQVSGTLLSAGIVTLSWLAAM